MLPAAHWRGKDIVKMTIRGRVHGRRPWHRLGIGLSAPVRTPHEVALRTQSAASHAPRAGAERYPSPCAGRPVTTDGRAS